MHAFLKSLILARGILIFSLGLFLESSGAAEMSSAELSDRIQALEKNVVELNKKEGMIQAFDAKNLNLGGFTNTVFGSHYGAPTDTQNYFQEADLNLILSGTVREKFRIFADLDIGYQSIMEDENAAWRSKGPFATSQELEIMSIEYSFNREFLLRAGKIITPFGYLNTHQHYDPSLIQLHKPQYLRDSVGHPPFEDTLLGVEAAGRFGFSSDHAIDYSIYLGTLPENSKRLAPGARVAWDLPGTAVQIGLSALVSTYNERSRATYGSDLELDFKPFFVQAEYFRSVFAGAGTQTSYYIQPSYHFWDGKIIVFAQLDYFKDPIGMNLVDDDQNPATARVNDPIEKFEYSAGVNYLPYSIWRMRLEYTRNRYVGPRASLGGLSRDYDLVLLSSTVSF